MKFKIKQYKIESYTYEDGVTIYYPMYKKFLFWHNFLKKNGLAAWFFNEYDARKYIELRIFTPHIKFSPPIIFPCPYYLHNLENSPMRSSIKLYKELG